MIDQAFYSVTLLFFLNFVCRQQRDEIARKKEKLESMLKGKKSQASVRPESPNSRRRRSLKRTTMPSRRLSGSRNSSDVISCQTYFNFLMPTDKANYRSFYLRAPPKPRLVIGSWFLHMSIHPYIFPFSKLNSS